jgi:hypothetical protein
MGPAVKAFEKRYLEGQILHGGHPILRWAVSNAVEVLSGTTSYAIKLGVDDGHSTWRPRVPANDSTFFLKLSEVTAGGVATTTDTSARLNDGTTYSIIIMRDDDAGTYGTLYAYIYNGSTLVDTLSIALTESQDLRYMYAYSSYAVGSGGTTINQTVSSVYLVEGSATSPVYVYDTRLGGTDEMYVFPGTGHESLKADYAKPSDTFQFDIAITSGALSIDRITAEVSSGRRS